jgi:hypothetical protein
MQPEVPMPIISPDSEKPDFLLSIPKPQPNVEKSFNRQTLFGWQGRMRIEDLAGWLKNPRLELEVDRFREEFAREPVNEELLNLLVEHSEPSTADDSDDDEEEEKGKAGKRNKLVLLAEDIRVNGVRTPLVVNYQRKLLDGNRRYFACYYLLKTAPQGVDDPDRGNFTTVPIWVLPSAADEQVEDLIVTELNFNDDWKVEWPYSVKARHLYRDAFEKGLSTDVLQKKYRTWSKSRIDQVLKAAQLAHEFVDHHDDTVAAREVADHLIWFDELRRSNGTALQDDAFKTAVFDLLMTDQQGPNPRFRRASHFKRLGALYKDQEAWEKLQSHLGPGAVRQAEFVIDRKTLEDQAAAGERMHRVNQLLRGLVEKPSFGSVEPAILDEFHQLAAKVPAGPDGAGYSTARMRTVVSWLATLTSKEIARLPAEVVAGLEEGLRRVSTQAHAYSAA